MPDDIRIDPDETLPIEALLSTISAEIRKRMDDDSESRKELCDIYKHVKEDFALHSEEAAMMAALDIWQDKKIGRAIAGALESYQMIQALMRAFTPPRHFHRVDEP